jgi:hypothetical protein
MDLSMPDKLKGFRHSLSLLRAAAIFWTSTTLRADPYASPIFGMLKTAMINSDKEVVGPRLDCIKRFRTRSIACQILFNLREEIGDWLGNSAGLIGAQAQVFPFVCGGSVVVLPRPGVRGDNFQ